MAALLLVAFSSGCTPPASELPASSPSNASSAPLDGWSVEAQSEPPVVSSDTTTTTTSNILASPKPAKKRRLSDGAVAGIVIGGFGGAVLVGCLIAGAVALFNGMKGLGNMAAFGAP
jgi:hypothetical protein